MRPPHSTRWISLSGAAVAGLVAGACSSPQALLTTGGTVTGLRLAGHRSIVAAQPIEVYGRIATRAASCWFGPQGRLRDTHIFHASVASPADGGAVSIRIHKRLPDRKRPWGAKAFEMSLTGQTSTTIAFTNISIPADEETRLQDEALAWANGKALCHTVVAAPAPPPAKTSKKAKKKAPGRKRPARKRTGR